MNIYPYVYRIDHPIGEFYIGSRIANKVPAEDDFGNIYKTSSKYLSHPFEEYTRTILAEFFTNTAKDDAYDVEQALIFEHWDDLLLVNKSYYFGKKRFKVSRPMSAEHKKRIGNANRGKVYSEEQMSARLIGRRHTDITKAKLSQAAQGPRSPRSEETKRKIAESLRNRKHYLIMPEPHTKQHFRLDRCV